MGVIVPCMGRVSTCWRGLFCIKTKRVGDGTLLNLTVGDKPISSHSTADSLDKPLSKLDVDLPDLPTSIIENILSRVSAKCIYQWQRHSKGLQVLTKTQYFTRMQLDRSSQQPVIIQQIIPKSVSDGNMELYLIHAESGNVQRKIVEIDPCYMQRDNPILLLGSHDGFLLFTNGRCSMFIQGRPVFYAWNPVTNQKSIFRSPCSRFHVCGFYFCSIKREYILLYVSKNRAPFEFKMYNIGTKSWEKVGNFSYPPSCDRPPVILNKTLFWMIDQDSFRIATGDFSPDSHFIVSFEFETNKFETIGHDGLSDMSVRHRFHLHVHLFELEEELYICDFSKWIKLELSVLDQGAKCWVRKHIVIVPIGDKFFRNMAALGVG